MKIEYCSPRTQAEPDDSTNVAFAFSDLLRMGDSEVSLLDVLFPRGGQTDFIKNQSPTAIPSPNPKLSQPRAVCCRLVECQAQYMVC